MIARTFGCVGSSWRLASRPGELAANTVNNVAVCVAQDQSDCQGRCYAYSAASNEEPDRRGERKPMTLERQDPGRVSQVLGSPRQEVGGDFHAYMVREQVLGARPRGYRDGGKHWPRTFAKKSGADRLTEAFV
jgi:hypothetical protein